MRMADGSLANVIVWYKEAYEMKTLKTGKAWRFITVLISLFLILAYPGVLRGGGIPSISDIIRGKAMAPTIEELTGGKVNKGDLIDKNNVDLVKDYLNPGVYETIKRGMVMRMGTQLPPDQLHPRYFTEATERNIGKAIMDESGTVYYEKMGTLWPGGVPFVEPKNGLEVMASAKFGHAWDDLRNYPVRIIFINSKGRAYKEIGNDMRLVYCSSRTKVPPLGVVQGYEKILFKRLLVITFPLELKGVGQYTVRYYDDAKQYDTGFAYLPAFKRTIRASATTWQDNIGGSDCAYQDGQGVSDPYSGWSFRLIESKYMLLPEAKSPFPYFDEKGKIDERVQYDVGRKFIRVGWCIWPTHVVEAIPKAKNIYGKKILFCGVWPYWHTLILINHMDCYDRQMKLWKAYIYNRGHHFILDGEPYTGTYMNIVYDLQADHMSQFWMHMKINQMEYKPEDITLRTLLAVGR